MTYVLTTAKAGRLTRQSAATPRQAAKFAVEELDAGADQVRVEAFGADARDAFRAALPVRMPTLASRVHEASGTELWILEEGHRQPLRSMAAQGKSRAPMLAEQITLDGLAVARAGAPSDAIRGGL